MHTLATVCVALACILPVVLSQQQRVFRWNVHEYPDPFSFDTYSRCGRQNRSNICDPNGLVRKDQADKVDKLIWRVYRETRCKCGQCIGNAHGYVIRVAVMPRMETILKLGNTTEDMLREAQMYSYILTQKWSMGGSCNESVLILFSRYDGILYTLTLPLARSVLKDKFVKRITMAVRHMFDDDDTIGDGLHEMIKRYMLIFEGNSEDALRPMVSAQRSNNAISISPSFTLSFLLTAVLLAVLR